MADGAYVVWRLQQALDSGSSRVRNYPQGGEKWGTERMKRGKKLFSMFLAFDAFTAELQVQLFRGRRSGERRNTRRRTGWSEWGNTHGGQRCDRYLYCWWQGLIEAFRMTVEEAATREFVAHTLNLCLGYALEEQNYTFSDLPVRPMRMISG